VYAADYARSVLDFQDFVIARDLVDGRWISRSDGAVRTLRLPRALGLPEPGRSRGVAGFHREGDSVYVHLVGSQQELALAGDEASNAPTHLETANAHILSYDSQPGRQRWTLEANVPLEFTLADADDCRVQVDGVTLAPVRRESRLSYFSLTNHAARPLEAICRH
jgi:hypothetical protein